MAMLDPGYLAIGAVTGFNSGMGSAVWQITLGWESEVADGRSHQPPCINHLTILLKGKK